MIWAGSSTVEKKRVTGPPRSEGNAAIGPQQPRKNATKPDEQRRGKQGTVRAGGGQRVLRQCTKGVSFVSENM